MDGCEECASLKQQSAGTVEQDNPLGEPILSPRLLNNSQIKPCVSAECFPWPRASREWDYLVNLDVAQGEPDLAAAFPESCRQSGRCHSSFFAPLHSFGATDFRRGSQRTRRRARCRTRVAGRAFNLKSECRMQRHGGRGGQAPSNRGLVFVTSTRTAVDA